jgi:hypothetical protein
MSNRAQKIKGDESIKSVWFDLSIPIRIACQKTGSSVKTLESAFWKRPKMNRRLKSTDSDILKMYQEWLSVKSIAHRLQIAEARVSRSIRWFEVVEKKEYPKHIVHEVDYSDSKYGTIVHIWCRPILWIKLNPNTQTNYVWY